jgi:hypothetical protein
MGDSYVFTGVDSSAPAQVLEHVCCFVLWYQYRGFYWRSGVNTCRQPWHWQSPATLLWVL